MRARGQAESYARSLPADEGRPPFLVIVDVGTVIQLYSDFTRSGATYTPFPDTRSHQIRLDQLRDETVGQRLRQVWLDPMSLDPSRQAAKVTRVIARQLADIAVQVEEAGHPAETVAGFLTRCLFTFFAEDVELIPKRSFATLLDELIKQPEGGLSIALKHTLPQFNGKLFKDQTVPKDLTDQVKAVTATLAASSSPHSADDLAAMFTGGTKRPARVAQILEMLTALGRARQTPDGRFAGNG